MADYLDTPILNQTTTEIKGKVQTSILDHSSTQLFPIGTKYVQDNRTFRYCKAGSAHGGVMRGAINGHIIPGDTGTPGYEGAAGYATTAGETVLQISDTGTTHTKNYYSGGYILIFNTQFECHYILSSTASDGTSLRITLGTALDADLAAAGVGVTLYPSIYSNVQSATSVQSDYESFVVLPQCSVTSGYYFWGQTKGPCWITAHGGTWPGAGACLRDVYFHTDGTIDPASIRDVGTLSPQRAGYLLSPSSTAAYGDAFIMLQLE
jgi:hypothetical protein